MTGCVKTARTSLWCLLIKAKCMINVWLSIRSEGGLNWTLDPRLLDHLVGAAGRTTGGIMRAAEEAAASPLGAIERIQGYPHQ